MTPAARVGLLLLSFAAVAAGGGWVVHYVPMGGIVLTAVLALFWAAVVVGRLAPAAPAAFIRMSRAVLLRARAGSIVTVYLLGWAAGALGFEQLEPRQAVERDQTVRLAVERNAADAAEKQRQLHAAPAICAPRSRRSPPRRPGMKRRIWSRPGGSPTLRGDSFRSDTHFRPPSHA